MGFGANNRIFTSTGYHLPDHLIPNASTENALNCVQIWDGDAFRDAQIFDEGYSTDLVQVVLTTGQMFSCTPDNLVFVKDPEASSNETLLVKRASELRIGDVFPDLTLPAVAIKPRPRLSKLFSANERDPFDKHGAEPASKLAWLYHVVNTDGPEQLPEHLVLHRNDIIMLFQSIGVVAQSCENGGFVEVTKNNVRLPRSWPIAEPVECSVKHLSSTHDDVWSIQSNSATIFIQGVCIGRATLPL